jgi:dUTP pyrophosphatase
MGSNNPMLVRIVQEPDAVDLPLPTHATPGSAGVDLYADLKEPLILQPGDLAAVSAGIRIAVPEGFEAQVRPRSGLARKHGISMVNTPGTIDSDYRGVVHALLINLGKEPFVLNRGERMAQMVIAPVARVEWSLSESLPDTDRGEGGFGHTGR